MASGKHRTAQSKRSMCSFQHVFIYTSQAPSHFSGFGAGIDDRAESDAVLHHSDIGVKPTLHLNPKP